MEKREAKRWLDKNMNRLMTEYGIPHWRIDIDWRFEESELWLGECQADPRYEHAEIRLNIPSFKDLNQFESVVRHELSHIIHSPYELFLFALKESIEDDKLLKSLESMFSSAAELTVKNIERMHHGHKETYRKRKAVR